MMIFSMIGLVVLFRKNKAVFYSTFFIFHFSVFLLSSWWAWSYGICWGMRPMIDYYPILAIPMAASFAFLLENGKVKRILSFSSILLLILLNLFQTWQYKNGLIHYDDMTKEAYFYGFFQTKTSIEWTDKLKPYDWERRTKGLPQLDFNKRYFELLRPVDMVIFRASNLQYLASNPKAQNAVAAYEKSPIENDGTLFHVEEQQDGSYCFLNGNGLYLSVNKDLDGVITASVPAPGPTEKFEIEFLEEDDNRLRLKGANNKYLTAGTDFPFIVQANGNGKEKSSIFRYYHLTKD
jgi:hypothetical protein